MREIQWSEEKNAWLKRERGIGFEDVVIALNENRALDVMQHPNTDKYPTQRILIVAIEQYAYSVPYVKTKTGVFLKTIIPSRKLTKRYLNS